MILTGITNKTLDGLVAAFNRLVDELNQYHPTISRLPSFADDTAAAEGNLKVGNGYVDAKGFVRRRVS